MIDTNALRDLLDSIPPEVAPGLDCEIRQNGKRIFRHSRGCADYAGIRPISANDMYWQYSLSKVITAVGVLRLVEQGLLGLYDPVENYLPEYAQMQVLCPGGTEPLKEKIRIYDMLRMCSGMSYELNGSIVNRMRTDPGSNIREFARLLVQVPLKFQPNSDFLYSFSIDVLGAVIEIVSKKSFSDYLQTEIFRPLGMHHTGFQLREDDTYRLAAQYRMVDDQSKYYSIGKENEFVYSSAFYSGGAGIVSTVDDMIIFADVLANGGISPKGYHLLDSKTVDLMRQDHLSQRQKESLHRDWPHLKNYSYGLGARTFLRNADGCGGVPGEFGWEGSAGNFLLIDPDNRISCVYAQHVRECNFATGYIHRQITRVIYSDSTPE